MKNPKFDTILKEAIKDWGIHGIGSRVWGSDHEATEDPTADEA